MEGCARTARERFDILPGDMRMPGLPEERRQTLLAGDQTPRAKPLEAIKLVRGYRSVPRPNSAHKQPYVASAHQNMFSNITYVV